MSKSYLERWAEEVLANHPDPAATVTPNMTRPAVESSLAAREAALAFVNRAGARLVAGCPACYPGRPAEAEYLVLVPRCNDGPEFRRCLDVLRIPYPVAPRTDPLSRLPARCQHVGEAK